MKASMEKLEHLLELGRDKNDITLLVFPVSQSFVAYFSSNLFPLTWHGSPSFCAACQLFWRQ